jgi:hypothetical protein
MLQWLAFGVEKGEQAKAIIISSIVKDKGLDEVEAEKVFSGFSSFYQDIKKQINFQELIKPFIIDDIKQRQENLPQLKERLNKAINFFNPKESEFEKIIYLPTNPLQDKQTGSGFNIGNKYYINTDKGNETNEVHEFLHSIINPITEKLNLTEEDQQEIIGLSMDTLKEDYEDALSILTEEIIRTYGIGFDKEEKPEFNSFKTKLLNLDKNILQKVLLEKGIDYSTDEFLDNDDIIRKYYEKYNNRLSERIWRLFEKYENSDIDNFENYLLENYKIIMQE